MLESIFGFGISLILLVRLWDIINAFPVSIGQIICLGQTFIYGGIPAYGWIYTIGLNGIKNWEGDLSGGIGSTIFGESMGVTGFKGIKMRNLYSGEVFYMGFARRVEVEYW